MMSFSISLLLLLGICCCKAHPATPSGGGGGGISRLVDRVLFEATRYVEERERPILTNTTTRNLIRLKLPQFAFSPHIDPHIGIPPQSPHALGSHNYLPPGKGKGDHTHCKFTPKSEALGKISNVNLRAFQLLVGEHGVGMEQALSHLRSRLPPECTREERKAPHCDPNSPYRTIDGSCNNLEHPWWGASHTEVDRIAPSVYEDGWNEPRGGGGGADDHPPLLPNPRLVSLSIHPDYIHSDEGGLTNMVPQFGQFLDHDMTLTPEGDRKCCSRDANNVDCFNIPLPPDDYFFSSLPSPQSCMHFTRSTPYCFPNLRGVREQMNIVTAFVDASHTYASEENRSRLLRSWRGGRLRENKERPGYLPTVAEVQADTGEIFEFMGTFYGGEERVNEMPALTVLQTLIFREHNRVAGQVARLRPSWGDERVFQESRRIVIAEWQNIVYGEYLPIILGQSAMKRFGLELSKGYSQYNPKMRPSIFHAFADAAYRFGHTLINGLIRMMRGFEDVSQYRLRDNYFNDERIRFEDWSGYELILMGLMQQNAQSYDPFITEDVTNFLMKEEHLAFGGDLIARNLQRGRDHGLPPYTEYRALCGLHPLTSSWRGRPHNIPETVWNVLETLYRDPREVDLFTGGLSEVPLPGALTGATFNCLKSLQFARAKFGDRFFFTHGGEVGGYSLEQIGALRGRRLGDLICQNSRGINSTSENVFRLPGIGNPMIPCGDPSRDLDIEMLLPK